MVWELQLAAAVVAAASWEAHKLACDVVDDSADAQREALWYCVASCVVRTATCASAEPSCTRSAAAVPLEAATCALEDASDASQPASDAAMMTMDPTSAPPGMGTALAGLHVAFTEIRDAMHSAVVAFSDRSRCSASDRLDEHCANEMAESLASAAQRAKLPLACVSSAEHVAS